jgi:DNA adenine methylase
VLLSRPNHDPTLHVETVNDKDGFIANVWRSLRFSPDEVAHWCDWPVNHADLIARIKVLITNEENLLENLCKDDTWHDTKIAGYWIWAASQWIGSGLTCPNARPHLSNAGMGVQEPYNTNIYKWFRELSERLRNVRVVCGDWKRVCGGKWQSKLGTCGIFFDPPYSDTDRDIGVYHKDDTSVSLEVARWAIDRGNDPLYRIVICGYDSEHAILDDAGWRRMLWKTGGGYGNTKQTDKKSRGQNNRKREVIWFSPHCINSELGLQL